MRLQLTEAKAKGLPPPQESAQNRRWNAAEVPSPGERVLIWRANLNGISKPWKVESTDHSDESGFPRTFAVKYFRRRPEQRERRVVEYVCASLASWLEIGAPQVELLEFTDDFLASLGRLRARPWDLLDAEPGRHVGISWVTHAAELIERPGAMAGLADRRQPAEIIGCDFYLQNVDRHDSNVLVRPAALFGRPSHKLVPIDWGRCLGYDSPRPDYLAAIVSDTCVRDACAGTMLHQHVLGVDDFAVIRHRIGTLRTARARLEGLIHWMPAEWDVPEEWKGALLEYFTRRIDVVIARLSDAEDAEGVFPNWQLSLGA